MKRNISALIVSVLFLSGLVPAFSAEPGSPEYQKMKEYKAAQRKAREAQEANGGGNTVKKAPGFWDREGERSGLTQTGQGMGSFFKNINPVPFFKDQRERYQQRRASAGK